MPSYRLWGIVRVTAVAVTLISGVAQYATAQSRSTTDSLSRTMDLANRAAANQLTAADSQKAIQLLMVKNQRNFREWRGIVLYCNHAGDHVDLAAELCPAMFAKKRLLAASTGLVIDTTSSAFSSSFVANLGLNAFLVLELTFRTTAGSVPIGVGVALRAWVAAQANSNERTFGDGVTVDSVTRDGDLILWDRDLVGVLDGERSGWLGTLLPIIDEQLSLFMTEFLEARAALP